MKRSGCLQYIDDLIWLVVSKLYVHVQSMIEIDRMWLASSINVKYMIGDVLATSEVLFVMLECWRYCYFCFIDR